MIEEQYTPVPRVSLLYLRLYTTIQKDFIKQPQAVAIVQLNMQLML